MPLDYTHQSTGAYALGAMTAAQQQQSLQNQLIAEKLIRDQEEANRRANEQALNMALAQQQQQTRDALAQAQLAGAKENLARSRQQRNQESLDWLNQDARRQQQQAEQFQWNQAEQEADLNRKMREDEVQTRHQLDATSDKSEAEVDDYLTQLKSLNLDPAEAAGVAQFERRYHNMRDQREYSRPRQYQQAMGQLHREIVGSRYENKAKPVKSPQESFEQALVTFGGVTYRPIRGRDGSITDWKPLEDQTSKTPYAQGQAQVDAEVNAFASQPLQGDQGQPIYETDAQGNVLLDGDGRPTAVMPTPDDVAEFRRQRQQQFLRNLLDSTTTTLEDGRRVQYVTDGDGGGKWLDVSTPEKPAFTEQEYRAQAEQALMDEELIRIVAAYDPKAVGAEDIKPDKLTEAQQAAVRQRIREHPELIDEMVAKLRRGGGGAAPPQEQPAPQEQRPNTLDDTYRPSPPPVPASTPAEAVNAPPQVPPPTPQEQPVPQEQPAPQEQTIDLQVLDAEDTRALAPMDTVVVPLANWDSTDRTQFPDLSGARVAATPQEVAAMMDPAKAGSVFVHRGHVFIVNSSGKAQKLGALPVPVQR